MSYYVVHRGRKTGIFENWEECKEQINGFSNAKFKKYNSLEEAKQAFEKKESITLEFPTHGIAVDAAFSMKRDIGEYQLYNLTTKEIIFKSKEYKGVTVNLMEFLAICKAIELYPFEDIYSDSATAITWIQKQSINSNVDYKLSVEEEVDLALQNLKENVLTNTIIKWDTSKFGDIPADFFRK